MVLKARLCKQCGQRFTNDAAFCPFDGDSLVDATDEWNPQADPLIGTIVDGRYRIQSALGEGGMGTVYQVEHVSLQRSFAMKVLRKDLSHERDLCDRFLQEARTVAAIDHPNVVHISDFGTLERQRPYFVMEFLEGEALSRLLQREGTIQPARAVRLLLQAAAGVGAAHRCGVVHRDLKPDNVFITRSGDRETIKLLDFGVAKVMGSAKLTKTGIVFGSPHYMAPEQASGQPVDHRTDIYSLGVVMYQLFTGRVPFEADSFMGVLTKHMFASPEGFDVRTPNSKDLGALEDITLRCLEKKPENRYASLDILIAEIENAVTLGSGNTIEVASVPHRTRTSSSEFRLSQQLRIDAPSEFPVAHVLPTPPTSRKVLAALVLGALVISSMIIAVALWNGRRSTQTAQAQEVQTTPVVQSAPTTAATPAPPPPEATLAATADEPPPADSERSTRRPPTRPANVGHRPPNNKPTSEPTAPATPKPPPRSEISDPWNQ